MRREAQPRPEIERQDAERPLEIELPEDLARRQARGDVGVQRARDDEAGDHEEKPDPGPAHPEDMGVKQNDRGDGEAAQPVDTRHMGLARHPHGPRTPLTAASVPAIPDEHHPGRSCAERDVRFWWLRVAAGAVMPSLRESRRRVASCCRRWRRRAVAHATRIPQGDIGAEPAAEADEEDVERVAGILDDDDGAHQMPEHGERGGPPGAQRDDIAGVARGDEIETERREKDRRRHQGVEFEHRELFHAVSRWSPRMHETSLGAWPYGTWLVHSGRRKRRPPGSARAAVSRPRDRRVVRWRLAAPGGTVRPPGGSPRRSWRARWRSRSSAS